MSAVNQGLIFLPVLALIGWTLIIFSLIPYRRTKSVKNGELRVADFALGESENVFPYVALANRSSMSLLELPVLFYIACLTYYVLQEVTHVALILIWLYVGFRLAPSLIHITINNAVHRGNVFGVSNFILVIIWLVLVFPILRIGGIDAQLRAEPIHQQSATKLRLPQCFCWRQVGDNQAVRIPA